MYALILQTIALIQVIHTYSNILLVLIKPSTLWILYMHENQLLIKIFHY